MHLADTFIQNDQIAFKEYILSAPSFPGNQTHNLKVASAMLYWLSYSKTHSFSFIKASYINQLQGNSQPYKIRKLDKKTKV